MKNSMVMGVGFNRDEDRDYWGEQDRVVRIHDDEDEGGIFFSFEMGKAEDDTVTLSFDRREFLSKLLRKE